MHSKAQNISSNNLIVSKFSIRGNSSFSSGDIIESSGVITKANSVFLGFLIGLEFYKVADDSVFSGKFSTNENWLQKLFGEPPYYFNQAILEEDIQKIKTFYEFNGYFNTSVSSSLSLSSNNTVEIEITISEGHQYTIQNLNFSGIESVSDSIQKAFKDVLTLKKGDTFSSASLLGERNIIVSFFQDLGYYLLSKENVHAVVDTGDSFCDISFEIKLGEVFSFGDINIMVNQASNDSVTKVDTIDHVSFKYFNKEKISPSYIYEHLTYQPGKQASPLKQVSTIESLYKTGIFDTPFVSIDSITNHTIFTTIKLNSLPRHELSLRAQYDNRFSSSGFVSVLTSYSNKNIFGNGEVLTVSGALGIQISDQLTGSIDLSAGITFPKFISSENRLRTVIGFSRNNFYAQILQTYDVLIQGVFYPLKSVRIAVSIPQLEVVNSNNNFLQNNGSTQNQNPLNIHTLFKLNLSFSSFLTSRKDIYLDASFSFEESGIVSHLLDKYVEPGYSINESSVPEFLGFNYWQYLKFSLNANLSFKFPNLNFLKFKIDAGYITPYGISKGTPFYKRFFVGGPSSLRAWPIYSLGPGYHKGFLSSDETSGGNVLGVISVDYSKYFFKSESFGIGLGLFADAGNVWTSSGSNSFSSAGIDATAFDAGIGLRLSTPVGIIYFDFAYPFRDPSRPSKWLQSFDLSQLLFSLNISIDVFR